MDAVYKMGDLRVIDLSKILGRGCGGDTRRRRRLQPGNDVRKHIKGPGCDHDDNWPSVAEVPLTTFMGRAIYVNIEAEPNSHITAEMLDKYCLPRMKDDTIVIIDSPHRIAPFTEKTNTAEDKRLFVNAETAKWFKEHKAKCVAFGDGVSIESSNDDVKPFHDILLAENIVFLEVLKNLDKLEKDVFFMSYAPLPIKGLDSCPVRAYAIEGLSEFSE